MGYKVGATFRVTATNHVKEEVVVDDLADIGAAIADGAPVRWDVAYVVVLPVTVTAQQWLANKTARVAGEVSRYSADVA
jgi:hypothetical protein